MELAFSAEPSLLNLALGIFILAGLLVYVYFQAPGIFDFFEEKTAGEYISEDDVDEIKQKRRPNYEVFLDYDHSDVDEWARWIITQDHHRQELAFNKLAEYLQRPIRELGVITTEVIRALVLLKHPFAFNLIVDFVNILRPSWISNSSAEFFYDSALRALVALSPDQAQPILLRELQELASMEDVEVQKEIVIRAMTGLIMNDELADILGTMLLEQKHKLETRKIIVAQLDLRTPAERKIFLTKSFTKFVDEFSINQICFDQSQILRSLFDRAYPFVAAGDKDVWLSLISALKVRHLQMDMIELMTNLVSDIGVGLKPWQLLGLIRLPGEIRKRFSESICKRFYMSDFEKVVIEEPILADEYPFESNVILVEKMKRHMFIPEFMDYWAAAFSTILIRKRNPRSPSGGAIMGMAIISGNGESEKIYLARATAANTNRSFVYIDAQRIVSFPEKLSELQKVILNARPCIVYIGQVEEVLQTLASGKESQRVKELIYTLKKLSSNPNVSIIASVSYGEVEAKRRHGTMFSIAYELNEADPLIREDMFRNYQMRLLERRAAKSIDVPKLLELFTKYTTIQFASALHKYVKTSLLCFGQIVPFQDYEKLMQELPSDEVEAEEINVNEDEAARTGLNILQDNIEDALIVERSSLS